MPWTERDVRDMALSLRRNLPLGVMQVLTSGSWEGGDLIQLDDDTTRPGSREIVTNYCYLKPVVEQFSTYVPSGYYCCDVFLALDDLFHGKLLIPQAGQCKKDLAGKEGARLKRLVGGLRYLWRSSGFDCTSVTLGWC